MGTPTYTVSGKSANNVDVITFDSASQIFTASNGGDSVVVASGNVNITINVNVVRNVNDIQYNVIGVQEVDGVISTALKSFQITSSTLPLDASNREVVVSVNDTNTATYNNSVITFLKSGTVTISLTALRNFSGSETIEKTIIATSTFGLATKFNVDEKIVIEDVGLSKNITFGNTFNPSDYTFDITHYTFSSLDSAIASVNNNGVILGKKWGTTTIYVSTNVLGSTITKSIVVEVQEKSDSVDFTFNGKIVNGGIILGDSITLGSKITPSETNNKSVRYCITEVVDGDVSDVVINETSGLLTFYKACTVKVTVETLDNGTTKTILIKKLTGPNELRVYYNENLVEDIIKLPANSANPILKVQPYVAVSNDFPDGILDFDLNEIDFSSENETALSIVANITDVGNFRYYTIVPTKTAVKSLATTITLRYGSTSEIVQIKFYSLQGISLVLDNEDDIEFGLEQTRVFGSYFNDNWNWGNKMKVEFTNTPTNVEDQLYWFVKASDTHYASFPSALSNEIQLNTNNINSALSSMTNFEGAYPTIKVTVFVGNESDYSLYDNLLTTPSTDPTFKWDYYTFTIVNGCNIFDGDDFDYAWQKYQRMVLHANIGTEEDRVEGQNFGTMSDTTKNTSNHMVDVYGNGYTLNFEGHLGSTNSVNEIPIYGDAKQYGVITNVNYKGQNIDSTKKTYTRSLVMYGGIMQYTTVQGFDLLYVTQVTDTSKGYYTDLKFYRCIFRHTSKCGLQLDGINRKQYVEDCIFYDVAQCAIDFQEGELYIKGFCDIYNFVTPSEYDSKYQSVIKDAFNSSEFSAYVDKSSGNSSTYQANVGICVASVASSPSVDTVYFWNESTQSYVANVDNLTGHKFTKISKTKTILFVVKVYLHMWLMPLDGATIKPVTSSSVPGDGSIPNLQKLYRIQ